MQIWGFDKAEISRAVGILRDEKKYLDHKDAVEKVQVARSERKMRPRANKPLADVPGFWGALNIAQMALKSGFGENWHLHPSQYCWAMVPKKFRSIKGNHMSHRMPQDIKVPLAQYWPGGTIPDIGLIYAGKAGRSHDPSRR